MNYAAHYERLIARAHARGRPEGYVERHHAIPRHAGGSDEPENVVWLTAREHFVAHMLLAMGGSRKDWLAVTFFIAACGDSPRYVNSRLYAVAAARGAKIRSESLRGIAKGSMPAETREKISAAKRGRDTLSADQRKALNERNKGRSQTESERKMRGDLSRGKRQRPEVVAARAKAMIGKKRTPEQRERIRQAVLNRGPVTQETREKQSAARKGRKHSDAAKEKMRMKAIEREAARRLAKAESLG
jgi:hypothetical protein